MSMLIKGSMHDTENQQYVLTCAQLVVFNSKKYDCKSKTSFNKRHVKNRETPVDVYTTLKIYSTVRSRNIIDHLFR